MKTTLSDHELNQKESSQILEGLDIDGLWYGDVMEV